ncbi:MAG: hypothetical protein ACXACY_10255 [Candidatus Hodarchaeales archaeon]|jgi:hypothetical protein
MKRSILETIFIVTVIFMFLNISQVNANDSDTFTGTVRVGEGLPEIFFDLDPLANDEIWEESKIINPLQEIVLAVQIDYVDNVALEINCTLFHDDGTDLLIFVEQDLVYDLDSDTFRSSLGYYPEFTTIHYYIECFDGVYTIRTPSQDYSQITFLDDDKTQTVNQIIEDPLEVGMTILRENLIVISSLGLIFVFIIFYKKVIKD